jgi:hypothetical protein
MKASGPSSPAGGAGRGPEVEGSGAAVIQFTSSGIIETASKEEGRALVNANYKVIFDKDPDISLRGRRGLAVKATGWLSLDHQFEPYLRAHTVAPSWCGLGCRSRTLMVEYISPLFLPC